jgi:ADP-heptose:LPS heptosyltransferase
MTPKKIILVQLYSNGDCLYATAVARQIKQDYPSCHLTWAIASFCKSIILNNPFVDKILEVDSVAKNDAPALRSFKNKIYKQKSEGIFDEVFFIHNADSNHSFYDGSIRSSILQAYQHPITVTVQPVVRLYSEEIEKANQFALNHELKKFEQVILFEYAPQSGQNNLNLELAIKIAENIIANNNFAIILSSANQFSHPNKAIIDGSSLTLRETAQLSHHCTFLLGSSSGITWITTSDAGKQLPMVQLLNANSNWSNPVSRDFAKFNIPNKGLIELLNIELETIINCVSLALKDFEKAKLKYNQSVPLQFRTTRYIVYNLLCYLEFGAIIKHIKVNREVYGNNWSFYKEVIIGFLSAPFRLLKNIIKKKILKKQ